MGWKIRIEMAGTRYGRLVGLDFSHSQAGHAYWLFVCDCGKRIIANGAAVRAGKTASCGCLHREICAERLTVHGRRARKRHDATYRAWQEINTYCQNPASPRYRYFGRLGVAVCADWVSDFERFAEDMGERPAGTVLSRVDGDGDFTPDNCRWTTLRPRSLRASESRHTERHAKPSV